MEAEEINLGFLAEAPSQNLRRWSFPSKLGGLPAWPEPRSLPLLRDLTCTACGQPQTFILQIYAPVEDHEFAFHRTLLLFGCMQCGSVYTLLRCQMPRRNTVYPSYPLSDIDASRFWSKWKEVLADSLRNQQTCTTTGQKPRKSLPPQKTPISFNSSVANSKQDGDRDGDRACTSEYSTNGQEERADTKKKIPEEEEDEEEEEEEQSSCDERMGKSGRGGDRGEDNLTRDIRRLQRQEAVLFRQTCPVCGLPSSSWVNEEDDRERKRAEEEEEEEQENKEQKKKRESTRELRVKKIFDLLHEREVKQENTSVIDLDIEDALVDEAKHRASLGVDRLHKRCEIFLEHRGRGLCCALPEFELEVAEEEEDGEKTRTGTDYAYEEELYKKYREEEQRHPDGVLDESEQEAFEEIHNERSSLDHQLVRFLKRCSSPASSRGHVLRYALGGSPLWPFSTNQLTTEPPACERCGAARQFECQVQPQLLFELRKFFEKRAQPLASDRKEKEEVVKEKKNKTKNEGEERGGEDRTLAGRDDNEEEASGDRRGAEENNRNVNGQEAKEGGGGGKGKKKEKTNEGGGAGEAKRDEKRQAIGGGKEVRKDPGTVAREEAAEVASERLHFALLCLYTCSAHCSGQGKVQEDSIEDEEEKVGNHRGRRKNQEKSEKSSYSRDDGRLVYPYTIEYVYVQPDPFYASAKEKKNQTTKERN